MPTSLKVHQAIARALADNGVDTIFGLLGDANMFMVDSFVRDCGGRFVAAANEAGSAAMALGYAIRSGRTGICSTTHGPAVTNTLTALIEGVKGAIPMVLLCGDTAVVDRENNQNVPQRELIVAAGAGFEQLRSAGTVAEDVARALRRAAVERRPIALNIPLELDWLDADYAPRIVRLQERRAPAFESEEFERAVGIIAAARRPVVLAGRGAVSPTVREALVRLAERIDAPVATTLKAKNLFQGHPFDLGVSGTVSTPASVDIMLEADCIVAFGASLTNHTMSRGSFREGKRIVQVDFEPGQIGKNFEPDAGIVGDPAAVADLLVHWLDEAEIPGSGFACDELRQRIMNRSAAARVDEGTDHFRRLLVRLDAALPADRVVVTDGGRFVLDVWSTIGVAEPANFLPVLNVASIGLSFPTAIGAAVAHPYQPVVVFAGDGGFMHGALAEFNTAVRYDLDIITVVCNDRAYGAEIDKLRHRDLGRSFEHGMIEFDWPDFGPLATALGGHGVTVASDDDWPRVEDAIRNRGKPLVIELKLDPQRGARA